MRWDEARVGVGRPVRVNTGKKVKATGDDDRPQDGETSKAELKASARVS